MLANMTSKHGIAPFVVAIIAILVAAPQTAQAQERDGVLHINSRGRRVRVVQGEPRLAQLEEAYPEELADPSPVEGNPDDTSWREQWDSAGDDSCAGGQCGMGCEQCGCMPCCCGTPFWAHRTYLFGEYLYLLPTDADMSYAIQQNGTGGAGTVPAGAVGVLQPDFTSAYRTGFGVALGCRASIGASYMNFHDHTTDSLAAPLGITGGTVASLVFHPESLNAGSTSSLVNASYDLQFQLADLEYRRLLSGNCRHAVNYSVGARYGKLWQGFSMVGDFAPPTGTIQTTTSIDFEGVGLRAGLDGEHRIGYTGFAGYGKASINVLFGEFRSSFLQLDTTTTDVQAFSTWHDRRVVPLLDYEVGVSWTSRTGHWRASAGYYTVFWFNTVTTGQWVQAVQNADFVDLGETITFNGFVTRLEFRL